MLLFYFIFFLLSGNYFLDYLPDRSRLQIPVSVNNDTNGDLKVQFKAASSTPALSLVSLKQSSEKKDKQAKELKRLLFDGHKNISVSAHGNKVRFTFASVRCLFFLNRFLSFYF